MKTNTLNYREISKDYLYDFQRNYTIKKISFFIAFIYAILYCFISRDYLKSYNFLGGIPIFFAFISGVFHTASLPPMLYLIPYSQEKRELYIQKMLHIKIGIPTCFALLWDFLALFISPISLYAFILQITMVVFSTYVCGTLYDGTFYAGTITKSDMASKSVYGKSKYFVDAIVLLSYIGGPVLFIICSDSISRQEFFIIFGIILLIFLPVINNIRKNWKEIRANFANYEIATKLEIEHKSYERVY